MDEMLNDMLAAWVLADYDERMRLYADLCKRVYELESYAIRAQDAFRRALLLEIPSAELRELRDGAPVAKPEPETAHSGVKVYNYAKDKQQKER